MHLDLTDILRDPGEVTEKPIAIAAGNLADEWELSLPVTGWVRASNARRNIVVIGKAQTAVKLTCARCLCEYDQPLNLSLDISVSLATFNAQLGAAAVAEDPFDDGQELTQDDIKLLFQEHHLDVSELVRQAIALSLPIQPLCRPNCPGLPEMDDYKAPETDPRLSALQALAHSHLASGNCASGEVSRLSQDLGDGK